MADYITKMHDRLDRICNEHYGNYTSSIITAVLDANPGLELEGIMLTMGRRINLPTLSKKVIEDEAVIPQIMLWD